MKHFKIEDLDQNFHVESDITRENIVWLDAKAPPFTMHGMIYQDGMGYLRMPAEAAERVSPAVAALNRFPAGGRIRFRTNSAFIGLKAVMENAVPMRHMPRSGQSSFDIYRKENGEYHFHGAFLPPRVDITNGYSAAVGSNGQEYEFTIHFPLYDSVKEVYIALDKSATIRPADDYRHTKPILFYGSSITEGGCASRPGNCYTALLSFMLDSDYVNLGFSGSGKGEQAMAEYIADQQMSVFVYDYDHNAPDAAYLEKTHLPFYRIVREKNPTLPIVILSAPPCSWPGTREIRKAVIKKTYETVRAEGDKNVIFIDGDTLFEGEFSDNCTVDGCHPTDLGFYRMATRIRKELQNILSVK